MIRVVSVSGGKDSTACAILALERHPKDEVRLVFADTGNEHELTLGYLDYLADALGVKIDTVRADFAHHIERKRQFVAEKWAEKGVPQEKIDRALAVLTPTGNPYIDMCIWKGRFPSRRAQFCTQELKIYPLGEYQMDLVDTYGAVESWQGVRRDESLARANAAEREDLGGGITVYRPIVDWTAQQTVDYSLAAGIKLNPLYSLGMSRVGCMPCINCRKGELNEIALRFPEVIDRIEEWERLVTEASKRGAATFFAARTDATADDYDAAEWAASRGIRERVEWSKTSRGGTQYDLLRSTDEPPACASAYGLCE